MEPKDLKNSKSELSGTQVEPETINDQDVAEVAEEQTEVAEVTESEETVVETVTEPVAETVEAVIEEDVTGVEESIVAEEQTEVEEVEVLSLDDEELEPAEFSDENNQKELTDYSTLNEVELINALRLLLENDDDRIKDDVEAIKVHFFRLYRANIEAQKAAFIEAGGDIAEFKAEPDPYELDLRELLKQYQDVRNDRNKKIDELKDENLQKKYDIIEEIKALINNKESINRTFHEFRELQNRWREIGLVPQSKLKDLWETYHHHVENFYDFIKINKEAVCPGKISCLAEEKP